MNKNIIIENFEHKVGAHCETSVLRNLLSFYGIELSEPMIFGIGNGLFFSHLPMIKLNNAPVTSFRPWPGKIFKSASKALGAEWKIQHFRDPEKAMQKLDENLNEGIPTGLMVGMFFLDYMPSAFRFHFNAHNIVAVGKENNSYWVSDPITEKLENISYDQLKLVRYAQGTFKPKGKLYYFSKIPQDYDLKKIIKRSIKYTANRMVNVPGPIIGVSGIRFLAKRLEKYPKKYSTRKANKNLAMIVRMQEEIGTGGAGFRFMYAAFLQEAAQIFNNEELEILSKKMTSVGDLWRAFAVSAGRIIKGRNKDETFQTIANQLREVADAEQEIFTSLKKLKL